MASDNIRQHATTTEQGAGKNPRRQGWLAAGGLLGAIGTASCCIGPLLLLSLGISGAWIGNLTALEPYKPLFAAVALACIVLGFRQIYFPKAAKAAPPRSRDACAANGVCARPATRLFGQFVLWSATVLVVLALSIDWWAPLLY